MGTFQVLAMIHYFVRAPHDYTYKALAAFRTPATKLLKCVHYEALRPGHRAVCSKFGGDTMGSLVAPNQIATEILDKIEARRLAQLTTRD